MYIQRGNSPGARLFKKFGEQVPPKEWHTGTKQGVYAMTADGEYLGAKFVGTRKNQVLKLMREALQKFDKLAKERGYRPKPVPVKKTNNSWIKRKAQSGLFLVSNSRDLPRGSDLNPGKGWQKWAWNQSWLEYTRSEMMSFIPRSGRKAKVPDGVLRKMARKHLIDNVRGENPGWKSRDVRKIAMTTEILQAKNGFITVRLQGSFTAYTGELGSSSQYRGHDLVKSGMQGFTSKLHGRAIFDTGAQKFIFFELVAVGTRVGGGKYNARGTDIEPAPMGVSFILEDQYDKPLPSACQLASRKPKSNRSWKTLALKRKQTLQKSKDAKEAKKKKASPEAIASRDSALRQRLEVVLTAGKKPRFYCTTYRSLARVVSMDDQGALTIQCRGVELPADWKRLTLVDRRSLALSMLRDDNPADHCLVGFYYLATGDAVRGEQYLAKSGECAVGTRRAFTD